MRGVSTSRPLLSRGSLAGMLVAGAASSSLMVAGSTIPAVAGATAPTVAPSAAAISGWELVSTSSSASASAPAYVGNGYVGTRVPAGGAGYAATPFTTETHIAGVYSDVPDPITGGVQHQGSVNLPGWTQLDVLVGGQRYAAADAQSYRQQLDLQHGVVTTTATWSSGGRVTDIRYDVILD